MIRLLLTCLLFTSCGIWDERPNQAEATSAADLKVKYDNYLELIKKVQDDFGFIETIRCDSLLLSGLIGAGGANVEIKAARNEEGQWFRRPLTYQECYASGESKSTISRDMLLGVMWYSYAHKDLELAQNMYDYATAHSLLMGEGVPSRTLMTPGLYSTLALLVHHLGGKSSEAVRKIPNVFDNGLEGFEVHLQELDLALRGRLLGGVTVKELESFKLYAEKNSKNPLYQAIYHKFFDHDQSKAIELLLSDFWPAFNLPNSSTRCDDWIVSQAPTATGWKSCPKTKETYSGGELLFIYYLIQEG